MATLNCFLHPHHVSLGKHYTSIHTLHQHIEDPYYGVDRRPSHLGVSVPRFDVREDEHAFYLDGEVPGITNTKEIFTEFVDNLTLIIRGTVKPKAGAEGAKFQEYHSESSPFELRMLGLAKCEADSGEPGKKVAEAEKNGTKEMIWKLKERRVGPFERSFTFPSRFKTDSMELSVEAGILSIKLVKDPEADKEAEIQLEIASEL
jgi:HSP20 family molecular chaperone IbpA